MVVQIKSKTSLNVRDNRIPTTTILEDMTFGKGVGEIDVLADSNVLKLETHSSVKRR